MRWTSRSVPYPHADKLLSRALSFQTIETFRRCGGFSALNSLLKSSDETLVDAAASALGHTLSLLCALSGTIMGPGFVLNAYSTMPGADIAPPAPRKSLVHLHAQTHAPQLHMRRSCHQ
eukprot:3487368-Rhodomonas_salina.1